MIPFDPPDDTGVTNTCPKQEGNPSFFSEKQGIFRWALLLGILILSVFALVIFWESAVEPRMGFSLTGESTDRSEALPPILEKAAAPSSLQGVDIKQEKSAPLIALDEKKEEFPAATVPSTEMTEFTARLDHLEKRLSDIINREEKRQKLWTFFLLLRQDVRLGVPFASSLQHFQSLLHTNAFVKEKFEALEPFARQGVWPFGKIITQFSGRYFLIQSEKIGFWQHLSHLFKNLWVVRKTDHPKSLLEQKLQEAEKELHYGNLEGALKILASLSISPDKAAQEWFLEANKLMKVEQAFQVFEQHLFQSAVLESAL